MNDLQILESGLQGLNGHSVPKPAGTLAGHAAGLPFEKLVHEKLLNIFPSRSFRHYEFLNSVLKSLDKNDVEERFQAFGPDSLQGLLCRGKSTMAAWSPSNLFEEKQNDTAESIVCQDPSFDSSKSRLLLVDVKTYNSARHGQPPNIISAGKLSEALASALEEGQVRFDIAYVGVSWVIEEETLKASDITVVSLFKMDPQLYINWAAAEQIQFHPHLATQNYVGSREEWAREFLKHFVSSLERRIGTQVNRLAKFKLIVAGEDSE